MISSWIIGIIASASMICCVTSVAYCPYVPCSPCPEGKYHFRDMFGCLTCKCVPDLCGIIKCPKGRVCKLNMFGRPICVCSEICPAIYAPVCGSDGTTYDNECLLNVAACKNPKKNITKVHDGKCDPCDQFLCPRGKFCEVDPKSKKPVCVCPGFCPLIYQPVCGSDGKTYSNNCFLGVESCKTGGKIYKVGDGPCPKKG